jgi:outer membrane protein assembly factor BamB
VTAEFVVAMGPKANVYCLRTDTGEQVWRMNMVEQFGTEVPPWYAGQCPLIEDGRVILAPGGDPLMMAVELASGEILWKTPNPGGWGMTHSSVTPMQYRGSRQYIYCTTRGVVGVDAEDGSLLWTEPEWKIALATVPSPVVVGRDRIFFSGGYDSGCMMVRLTGEGADTTPETVWKLGPRVFGAEQQTPILYEDHFYGVIPSGELACLNLEGERLWTSGKTNRFELGPFLIADGLLLVLHGQEGILSLIRAQPDSYEPLANVRAIDGHDIWGPMAMVEDLLLLRDVDTLKCLRLPTRQ